MAGRDINLQEVDRDFYVIPCDFTSLPWVVKVISKGITNETSQSNPTSSTFSNSDQNNTLSPTPNTNLVDKVRDKRARRNQRRKLRQRPNTNPSTTHPSSTSNTTSSEKQTKEHPDIRHQQVEAANKEREQAATEARVNEARALLVEHTDLVSSAASDIVSNHGNTLATGMNTLHQNLTSLAQLKKKMQIMRDRIQKTKRVLKEDLSKRNVYYLNQEIQIREDKVNILSQVEYIRQTEEKLPNLIKINNFQEASNMLDKCYTFFQGPIGEKLLPKVKLLRTIKDNLSGQQDKLIIKLKKQLIQNISYNLNIFQHEISLKSELETCIELVNLVKNVRTLSKHTNDYATTELRSFIITELPSILSTIVNNICSTSLNDLVEKRRKNNKHNKNNKKNTSKKSKSDSNNGNNNSNNTGTTSSSSLFINTSSASVASTTSPLDDIPAYSSEWEEALNKTHRSMALILMRYYFLLLALDTYTNIDHLSNATMNNLLDKLRRNNIYASCSHDILIWLEKHLPYYDTPGLKRNGGRKRQDAMDAAAKSRTKAKEALQQVKSLLQMTAIDMLDPSIVGDDGQDEDRNNTEISNHQGNGRRRGSTMKSRLGNRLRGGIDFLLRKKSGSGSGGSGGSDDLLSRGVQLYNDMNDIPIFSFEKEESWEKIEQWEEEEEEEEENTTNASYNEDSMSNETKTNNYATTLHPYSMIDNRRMLVEFARDLERVCNNWDPPMNVNVRTESRDRTQTNDGSATHNNRRNSFLTKGKQNSLGEQKSSFEIDIMVRYRIALERLQIDVISKELTMIRERDDKMSPISLSSLIKGKDTNSTTRNGNSSSRQKQRKQNLREQEQEEQEEQEKWTIQNGIEKEYDNACVAKSALDVWSMFAGLTKRFKGVPSDFSQSVLKKTIEHYLEWIEEDTIKIHLEPNNAWCWARDKGEDIDYVQPLEDGLFNASVKGADAVSFPPGNYRMLAVSGDLDSLGLVVSTLKFLQRRVGSQGVKSSEILINIIETCNWVQDLIKLELQLNIHMHMRLMLNRRYNWNTATASQKRIQSVPAPEAFISSLIS